MKSQTNPRAAYFQWRKISSGFLLCITVSFYARSQDTAGTYKIMKALPDVLVMADGTPVTSVRQWNTRRRPELLKFFSLNMYGQSPAPPKQIRFRVLDNDPHALGGLATRKQVAVFFNGKPDGPRMDMLIYLPNKVKHPVPVFVGLNFHGNQAINGDTAIRMNTSWMNPKDKGVLNNHATEASRGVSADQWPVEMILKRGYGIATMYAGDITPDYDGSSTTGVQAMYPRLQERGDNFGAIAAWAWGLSRAMDYFETDPQINRKKIILFGTSRMGKAAIWAGATDQRFAVVISNESGAGGAKLFHHWYGENIQRLCTRFPYWYCHNFRQYIGKDTLLPFDQHMVLALIAPRPLYVASAEGSEITDSYGEFLGAKYADPVYRLFHTGGLPASKWPEVNQPVFGRIGYHMRSGKHDILPYDWEQFLHFADMHTGRN